MARRRKGQQFFGVDGTGWFSLGGGRRRSSMNSMIKAMQSYKYQTIFIDEASELSRSTFSALNITTMKTLTPQQEALLDADTQTLLQAGFLNDNLTPSDKGLDASEGILFETNKAALVVKAAAIIEAAKTVK